MALHLWVQEDFDVNLAAVEYVNPELGVANVEDALGGARDIIAEWVSEDSTARGGNAEAVLVPGYFLLQAGFG